MSAPERIWAWRYSGAFNRGEWTGQKAHQDDVEYIRADLATLSDAVAEREGEPVVAGYQQLKDGKWVECSYFVAFGWGNTISEGCRVVYTSPPTSELEAENARLRAERNEATAYMRNILTSFVGEHFPDNDGWKPLGDLVGMLTQIDNALTITREYKARLAEAMKALEPFAEIAGEAWADGSGWTNAACQNDRICDWFGPSAFYAARRVREGGKVE